MTGGGITGFYRGKLTSAAFKLLWTVTGESVPKVTTGAPVLTSVSVTLRISEGACLAFPVINTFANKVGHQINAEATITTRIW